MLRTRYKTVCLFKAFISWQKVSVEALSEILNDTMLWFAVVPCVGYTSAAMPTGKTCAYIIATFHHSDLPKLFHVGDIGMDAIFEVCCSKSWYNTSSYITLQIETPTMLLLRSI